MLVSLFIVFSLLFYCKNGKLIKCPGVAPAVESEAELICIGLQALDRDVAEDAVNAALQHRLGTLYLVGMDTVTGIACYG